MINPVVAWVVAILLVVYVAVELGWGGGGSDFDVYRRPRDPLWPRWRWRPGPPKPGRNPIEPAPPAPRTKAPEPVE